MPITLYKESEVKQLQSELDAQKHQVKMADARNKFLSEALQTALAFVESNTGNGVRYPVNSLTEMFDFDPEKIAEHCRKTLKSYGSTA